jgi:hypothetical protein
MRAPKRGFDRRTFLKAAGLAGLSSLAPSIGRGDPVPGVPPRRLVLVLTELGWNPFDFRIAPPGAPEEVLLRSAYHPAYRNEPDELRWELSLRDLPESEWSPTLRPLYGLRDQVLALDGLGMLSIGADHYGDAHAKGWNHAITGHPSSAYITGQRAIGGAPSIDRRLQHHLEATEPHLTDLATLRLDVNAWWSGGGTGGFHHWFHDVGPSGDYERYPTIGDPRVVYDRLFGRSRSGGRRRVLDALQERYAARFPHLGRQDRERLEQHRQRLRDIESRLDRLDAISCDGPDIGDRPADRGTSESWLLCLDAYEELITAAFACDLTRVVALSLDNHRSIQTDVFGAGDHDFHEWYSHGTNPPKRWRDVPDAGVSSAEHDKWLDAAPVLATKNRWHLQKVAELAERLRAVPEGDGTLLDHTLIVVMDEISHGSHGHDQWPVVMIGGFGGEFRTGRYIRFPRNNPDPGINSMGGWVGQPHNQLLISILQGMGMEIDDLGIDGVYARGGRESGRRISLTGRLHELY